MLRPSASTSGCSRGEPRNAAALNNLAWILAADPKAVRRAEELLERAMREVGVTGELLDTRARVRITAKQYEKAEKDERDALTQGRTPLRLFHVAVLRMSQTPPLPDEARQFFRDAREGGLDANGIHPADLPLYRVLETRPGANPH